MIMGSLNSSVRQYGLSALIFGYLLASSVFALVPRVRQGIDNVVVKVLFSPSGGCTDAIINILDSSKKEVYIQAYSFTSQRIIDAVIAAKKRGLDVQVILDRSHKESDTASTFKHFGVPTFIDSKHAIAHNKLMLIDGSVTVSGSFNFTNSAESRNAENLLILRSSTLANQYRSNWMAHREHSNPYSGR